jgi:hypothetical protein
MRGRAYGGLERRRAHTINKMKGLSTTMTRIAIPQTYRIKPASYKNCKISETGHS